MSVGDRASDSEPEFGSDSPMAVAVDGDPAANLRVDCYVRSAVPPAITGTLDGIVERLGDFDDRDLIDDYRVARWPPECHSISGPTDGNAAAPSRDELVAEFERWAARNGHSLEPAFRRREIPSSPFAAESTDLNERVRVPVVALSIYEADAATEDPFETDAAEASLRGVVPYTEHPGTKRSRTYTVDDWLTALEASDGDAGSERRLPEDLTPLGGRQ